LARKLTEAVAAGGKLSFLNDQNRKAVLDGILQPATLADEPIALQQEPRSARVQWAAENVEQFGTNHGMHPRSSGVRTE
jgi:hypothetical protein